jgi:hypothetical protein
MKINVNINFLGIPLEVVGYYSAGEPERWNGLTGVGNPAEPASFEYESAKITDCPQADVETLLSSIAVTHTTFTRNVCNPNVAKRELTYHDAIEAIEIAVMESYQPQQERGKA